MLDIRTALLQGTDLLEGKLIPAARLTAEVLLCHALKRERSYLYAHPEEPLSQVAWIHYGRYLHERLDGKPTQYITKKQEFYGRDFRVTPDVLIPRPETEHLVEATLARIQAGDTVLDVGTGSGAIAITLALETKARVFGCDLSGPALRVALANQARLGAAVGWFQGDLASAIGRDRLDVVVSNPPYVPKVDEPALQTEVLNWEPHLALFGGPTGIDFYQRIVEQARTVLRPGGWLLFELGYNSLRPVEELLAEGWCDKEVVQDLAGFSRVIAVRRK